VSGSSSALNRECRGNGVNVLIPAPVQVLVLQRSCRLECGVIDALIAERVSWVETYILMAICLVCFLGTIGLFRLLLADRDQAMLIGAAAGLLIAVAAGGGYYTLLASCVTCK
jgi:hypothetical protein